MEQFLPIILGSSWASGINLYMTSAGLGIAHRLGWLALPGDLSILSHPLIIAVAIILYAIEFIADKVPFFDSIWDMVHTFIRPVGGALIGYLAMAHSEPVAQAAVAMFTGAVALNSHLAKATTRAAINAAPTGIGNSVASVTEDTFVLGVLYFMIKHPIISCFISVLLIVITFWILKKLFGFLKNLFHPIKKATC